MNMKGVGMACVKILVPLKVVRETTENLSQVSLSMCQDLNSGP
jgi:hypothetical protein